MKFDTKQLPNDMVLLQKMVRELLDAYQNQGARLKEVEDRLAALQRMTYGRKSEQLDPSQQRLAFDGASQEPAPPPPPPAALAPQRKGHGRGKLPAHLPRERTEHTASDDQLRCPCGTLRHKIGEETSERLDYRPASFYVRQVVRFKYACADCKDAIVTAEAPGEVIDKGLPGTGLLAHVAVSKYADHLPLARLEKIFGRSGVRLSRSTMCGWIETTASLLEPLVTAMRHEVLQSFHIHTDDTPVPVLDETLDRTRTGRLWVYVGDLEHPHVVFDYTPNRKRDGAVQFLGDFSGYLQADAYAGYDAIYAGRRVHGVACWAHARRKFFDAQTSDKVPAQTALDYIRALYDVEDAAVEQELTPAARGALRRSRAGPVLADLRGWLDRERVRALPKSALGLAIGYALNQWQDLVRYLDDGRLAIDNNEAERQLRHVAVGRKNWTFAGSDDGGRRAAILYSLIATCKRHDVEPFAYLRDVLERISTHPASAVRDLLPDRWAPADAATLTPAS